MNLRSPTLGLKPMWNTPPRDVSNIYSILKYLMNSLRIFSDN